MNSLTADNFLIFVAQFARKNKLNDLVKALKKQRGECVLLEHDEMDSLTFNELGMSLEEKIEVLFPNAVPNEVVWDVFCKTPGRIKDLYDLVVGNVKIERFAL